MRFTGRPAGGTENGNPACPVLRTRRPEVSASRRRVKRAERMEVEMAFIRVVSPSEGGPELASTHAYMREVCGTGTVANIVRLFSQRPASMRRMIRSWELAMWTGDEPRASRELIAAMVSRINQCVY